MNFSPLPQPAVARLRRPGRIGGFPAFSRLALALVVSCAATLPAWAQNTTEATLLELRSSLASATPTGVSDAGSIDGRLATLRDGLEEGRLGQHLATGVREEGLRLAAPDFGPDFRFGPTPEPIAARTSGLAERDPSKPWRLQDELEAAGAPDWLKVSGSIRLRYEGLDGQFRGSSRLGNDQHGLFIKSLLKVSADFDTVAITAELEDGRQYFANRDDFLNTGIVNTVELLQAHVTFRLGELANGTHMIRGGRQTLDLGSRRLVARNRFRNTINGFTGLRWEWKAEDAKLNVFYFLPQRRLPSDFGSLRNNQVEFDEEDFDQQFFGFHYERDVFERHRFEFYAYGLLEDVTGSRDRDIFTIGTRFYLPKKTGEWDYEVEGAYQFGRSRLSGSGDRLDHNAFFVHAHIAYTFDAPWQPRLRLALDVASGDDDPNDGDNNRFETLFGARRFEYGPTGIFGAVARFNLLSPELRLEVKPIENAVWMFAWRPVALFSDRDAWTAARVQDATGSTNGFVGHQIETRFRWNILPKSVRLEAGLAYLTSGEFQEDAPNGQSDDSFYGYFQARLLF